MIRFSAFRGTLRNKFLLALAVISALLTFATLLIVRQRVEIRVRNQIVEGLQNSVATFGAMQRQREATLERSAALLAALPPVKAVLTSQDTATIQDASKTFWDLAGSELFVLADSTGRVMALHTSSSGFTRAEAQAELTRSSNRKESRAWWFGGGHLFQVFLQPVYFGSAADNTLMGTLAVGYEIDSRVASDISRVASSQVAFRYGDKLVVSTIAPEALRQGRYLDTTVRLSSDDSVPVTLTVMKSYDEATEFLTSLNRWIAGIGLAAVLAGSILVYFVSTTFTRPLGELVSGVKALEAGDFAYPLQARGSDEVSALTAAFQRMRVSLQEAQRKLVESERLATIGRMASTISHDLRHPLTAILAYAEFLAESNLDAEQRNDFFQEIRIAVNRMTDEINSLLGFSKHKETIRRRYTDLHEVIARAIQSVRVLPEFESIQITCREHGDCYGWFDPAKVERVLLNLLYNACEAVSPDSGKVEIETAPTASGFDIRISDNGPGIPEEIRESLFQPFVSHGKERGTGLGLTVVQKIMQDHGGQVAMESTGPGGTVFRLTLPCGTPEEAASSTPSKLEQEKST